MLLCTMNVICYETVYYGIVLYYTISYNIICVYVCIHVYIYTYIHDIRGVFLVAALALCVPVLGWLPCPLFVF